MTIDAYSKAIGILYATGEIIWGEEEMTDTARRLQREALQLLEQGKPPAAPVTQPQVSFVPVSDSRHCCTTQIPKQGCTTTISSTAAEPEPEDAPVSFTDSLLREPEQKSSPAPRGGIRPPWEPGIDSFIRIAGSAKEAVASIPDGFPKSENAVQQRWYDLRQKGRLLIKSKLVRYTGDRLMIPKTLGKIISYTEDKTQANVSFADGDLATYQVPISDLENEGETP